MKRLAVFLLFVACFASRAVAFGFAPSTASRQPDAPSVLVSNSVRFGGAFSGRCPYGSTESYAYDGADRLTGKTTLDSAGSNYLKGRQWATDNPRTTPDFAKGYGLPAENTAPSNWVVKGRAEGEFTTRRAPPSHNYPANTGGRIKLLPANRGDVRLEWFHMPDEVPK